MSLQLRRQQMSLKLKNQHIQISLSHTHKPKSMRFFFGRIGNGMGPIQDQIDCQLSCQRKYNTKTLFLFFSLIKPTLLIANLHSPMLLHFHHSFFITFLFTYFHKHFDRHTQATNGTTTTTFPRRETETLGLLGLRNSSPSLVSNVFF